ncbi:MAG: histidine--tRNA ligase [Lachnospiraceae bacterium]|nr:histidine--tRNA ligase [Lachnospiraceae bacterium]MDD3795970.1 histidine--tRNA ligase [Lachnospiraceae bacterium]
MKFISTPVKGMNDFLPEDMRLREHVLTLIKQTYATYGFDQIETPAMEHIENLTGKQGGENEKLIFKIMKRGRELEKGMETGELSDSGLRYDLTVPLARYYSNNKNNLPTPLKALQIGNVWRADKPQKGRFRQFTQCDIDIIGDSSIMAEIELVAATSKMLTRIFSEVGIREFTVHINDRRILKGMAAASGFTPEQYDDVFIILDKMDKIGLEGVKESLLAKEYPAEAVENYIRMFEKITPDLKCGEFCKDTCASSLEAKVPENIDTVMNSVTCMVEDGVHIVFDPTLVRGMSYYTGTIFEISIDGYNFSIAGGGRYDEMIGRFSNQPACACGFSIGFERIITILKDLNWKEDEGGKLRTAFLVDEKADPAKLLEVFKKATKVREQGMIVTVQPLKKNAKFQIETLEKNGYTDIKKVYNDTEL